jgi:hypothetical protein
MHEATRDLNGDPSAALMSVVLATDTLETILPVVRHLRHQTVRERLELVIVAPDIEAIAKDAAELDGFAAVRLVSVKSLRPFGSARAAGVEAARAPLIFIGETHTYAHPSFAEELIRAHAGPWAAVVPGFGNANPRGALSCSIFLLDYGPWFYGLPTRETTTAPTHNVAYKREVLLELGTELGPALTHGDRLAVLFRDRKHRTHFHPAARIDHLNVTRVAPWLTERLHTGLLIGGRRAARWPLLRRFVYFCGAPLIPFVLLQRIGQGARCAARESRLPAGTFGAMLMGTIVSTVGEMIGYVRGTPGDADVVMLEMEVHKTRYASSRAPAVQPALP